MNCSLFILNILKNRLMYLSFSTFLCISNGAKNNRKMEDDSESLSVL